MLQILQMTDRHRGIMKFLRLFYFVAIGIAACCSLGCTGRQTRQPVKITPRDAPGFDATALSAVLTTANTGDANIHSIIVERHGKIVAELYRSGPDRTMMKRYGMGNPFASDVEFGPETLHDVRSVSKSVTALLYGLSSYEKILPPLHTTVLSEYPGLQDLQNAERNRITLAHFFTMSSGLDWKEWGRGFLTSDETRLLWKADPVRFVLDRPQAAEAGQIFNYSGGNTAVLADLLSKKTGKPLSEIARTELFEPLGITDWQWATDSGGRALPHAGLRLSPRDMVKLGRLVLNKGKWNGKQLISKSWIEESTRQHILTGVHFFSGSDEELGYGYQWWTGHSAGNNRKVAWTAAIGNGGQRIYVVPELDMTVVMTAGDYGSIEIHRVIGKLFDAIVAAALPN